MYINCGVTVNVLLNLISSSLTVNSNLFVLQIVKVRTENLVKKNTTEQNGGDRKEPKIF